MKLLRLAVCVAFLGTLGVARADAPAPAEPVDPPRPATGNDEARWQRVVQVMSRVLDGSLPRADLATAVGDHAWIAPFARNRAESARLLADRVGTTMRLVSARSFIYPSTSAAADLIGDVEKSGNVTAAIARRLKPEEADEDLLRRAESAMSRWLAGALDATPGTPVGVIALYDDGRRGNDVTTPPALWFVLVRGDFDVKGEPSVSRVLYGTMDAALR